MSEEPIEFHSDINSLIQSFHGYVTPEGKVRFPEKIEPDITIWRATCSQCGEVIIKQKTKPNRCKNIMRRGPRSWRLCRKPLSEQTHFHQLSQVTLLKK